ncbi:monocarboxylate transporter 13-like [Macrobrachium nipponense]|uniref:monocarboxylate transporter 13-like n=1 Tax=Macrobrachium nipponense TaxID=159736 RepID=UPI0030C7E902
MSIENVHMENKKVRTAPKTSLKISRINRAMKRLSSSSEDVYEGAFVGDDAYSNSDASVSVTNARERYEPPDGGWGWVVAAGCFCITTLTSMIGPCFGVLFSRFLLSLNTSSTTTAWIFNIFLSLWNGTGLFVRPLIEELGWRPIAIAGALINVMAFITTAFVSSAQFLYFTFSLLSGIGGGTIGYICFTILPHFFYKHRGVANAIMMGGICMGQFVGPPVLRYLQDEYGFRGSSLITGAIMLNAIGGAAVFQPPEWHLKKVIMSEEESGTQMIPSASSHINKNVNTKRGLVKSQSGLCLGESIGALEAELNYLHLSSQKLNTFGSRNEASNSLGRKTMRNKTISEAKREQPLLETQRVELGTNCNEVEEKQCFATRLWDGLKQIILSVASDLSQLKSPTVFVLAGGALCAVNGYLNFIMMVPFAMQEAGHSLQSSAWCISVSAVTNLVARMMSSALSDWKRFNVKFCYIFGVILMAITQLVFPFVMDDLRKLMIIMGFWGWGVGASMGVYNLVIISVVGVKRLGSVFGTSSFMVALGFLVIGPVIGYVRDTSGSYAVSVWCLGGLTCLTLLLWTSLPLAISHELKMKESYKQAAKVIRNP